MSGGSKSIADEQNRNLQDVFVEGWQTYEFLEDTSIEFNGPDFQGKVVMAMEDFELATRIVSETSMFSSNETVDEVSTESLQYMLLPYFLGKLALKRNEQDRADVLRVADIYFRDFIRRCHEYDLCDLPKQFDNNNQEEKDHTRNNSSVDPVQELVTAAMSRNNKIAQFRRKKELDEYIKKLKDIVRNQAVDDELKRDFFIKLIKKSVMESLEELDSIAMEKDIVEMRKVRIAEFGTTKLDAAAGISQWDLPQPSLMNKPQCSRESGRHPQYLSRTKPKPLQPFIITRNAAQKTVFGIGYPSLPVLTVDEFYQQRVDEGIFPDEEKAANINKLQALAAAQNPIETEEKEKVAIEEQIESDDSEYLQRMRNMDEYKDVVRRGDGNRYNRS
uniref:Immunoglobulin-binding protein 1 n=1 Tax=Glossina brevipalpis TaxID=37001 RepID=A0A1A9W069_9MUSC